YGYNGSGRVYSDALYEIQQTDQPFYTAGARISIPLTRTTVRNAYRADKAAMEQIVLRLKKLEQTILVSIDNDLRIAESNFEQVAATHSATQYAEAALDAEQKKLDSGKSTTYT